MATIKQLDEAVNLLLDGGSSTIITATELLDVLRDAAYNYAQNYIRCEAEVRSGEKNDVCYHLQLIRMIQETILTAIARERKAA